MNDENLNLKGGVLITGSLLWQDYLTEPNDNIRKNWRNNHISLEKKIMVKVPIRYGRLSSSDIYTMTFSKALNPKKYGTAYFVPFKKAILRKEKDVIEEVKALSKAEGMGGHFCKNWGVIGILFNNTIDPKIKLKMVSLWKSNIGANDNLEYKVNKSERSSIKPNGRLNFRWIKPVDNRFIDILNSYDFLIAATTRPKKYPNTIELSENVKKDDKRFYFIENYKNGITTFQDISVLNSL